MSEMYPTAPFNLFSWPCPLFLSQPSLCCAMFMSWQTMCLEPKAAKAICVILHSGSSFRTTTAANMEHKPMMVYDGGQQQHSDGTFPPKTGFTERASFGLQFTRGRIHSSHRFAALSLRQRMSLALHCFASLAGVLEECWCHDIQQAR